MKFRTTHILLILLLGFKAVLGQDSASAGTTREMVRGQVVSSSDRSVMEGVEISYSGLEQPVLSDSAGNFSIPFPGEERWFRFRYPEYSEKEIVIPEPGNYRIVLSHLSERSLDQQLEGYFGFVIKYKSSAFEYLREEQLVQSSYTTVGDLIKGRFSGVSAMSLSGMPGSGNLLELRGNSSLFASSGPLIILDGMPVQTEIFESRNIPGVFHDPLASIDAADIQQIEIIKDGGSLYGMRGGNGLIRITTRQPESVTTKVRFFGSTGITLQPDRLPLLDASQHKALLVNQLQNTGLSFTEILQQHQWISGNPSYYYYYDYDNNTDWQEEIFKPAYMSKFNVNLEGGDEIAQFAVLLGFMNQQGAVENTRYQRYNFRMNSNIRILEKLTMVSNVGFTYNVSDLHISSPDNLLNPVLSALTKSPMYDPYLRDSEGNKIAIFQDADEFGFSNPAVITRKSESNSLGSDFNTNLKLLYSPLQNLVLSNITQVNFSNIRDKSFIPDYGIVSFQDGEVENMADEGAYKKYLMANESRIAWNTRIDNRHFIWGTGGIRLSSSSDIFNSGTVINTPTDEFRSLSSVTLVQSTMIEGTTKKVKTSDLFVQGRYRFKDKYILDATMTLSASSNTGKKASGLHMLSGIWGLFPSVHGAWLISSEPFLKTSSRVDLLKLRASYSVSGNDYFTKESGYWYESRTYAVASGLVRDYIPNESLKWEEIRQLNAGLDLVVLDESLALHLDLFNRNTFDLLMFSEAPDISGFKFQWENNGNLQMNGMELAVEAVPVHGRLQITTGGILSLNRSHVKLDHDVILDVPGGHVIIPEDGSPFSFYGYETDGLFQNDGEVTEAALINGDGSAFQAGDVSFVDQDQNGTIDVGDRIALGDMFPTVRAGVNLTLRYGRLGLTGLAEYSGGNKIFNYSRMQIESMAGYENQSIIALEAWKNESDRTDIPRIALGDPAGNARFSDRWIEDGSYLTIREVTLSFDIPATKTIKNLRIYISGQNLLVYSKYLGYSPEFSYGSVPYYHGIDYGQMPHASKFVAGVNIGF